MTDTLYTLGQLDTRLGLALAGLIGVLFGFFLEQAGFGSSRRLTALFTFQDMAVVKVLSTAMLVALLGLHFLTAAGWIDPAQASRPAAPGLAALVAGVVLGIGVVLGGWCPSTALVGLASAKLDAGVFIVGAILGGVLFEPYRPSLQPLLDSEWLPGTTLVEALHLDAGPLTLQLAALAILACGTATLIERWFGGHPRPPREVRVRHAAGALLILGLAYLSQRWPAPPAADPADRPEAAPTTATAAWTTPGPAEAPASVPAETPADATDRPPPAP